MNINVNDAIKLSDDKTYIVCSAAIYNDKKYLYLVCVEDNKNQKFVSVDKQTDKLVLETDMEVTKKVMPLLLKNGIENINETMKN